MDPTAEAEKHREEAQARRKHAMDAVQRHKQRAKQETHMGREGNDPDAKPYGTSTNTGREQAGGHWIGKLSSQYFSPPGIGEAVTPKKKKKTSDPQFWDYNAAPYNSSSINNEEVVMKKKYKKPNLANKQIMGQPATFGAKDSDDDSKPAGMAQNPYESVRYVIPAERPDMSRSDGVEVGYDKTVEPEDKMAQLKRRKALKLAQMYRIDEDGVWGGGGGAAGGWAGEPDPGTTNTSQAGGTNYRLKGGTPEEQPYNLKKGKKMKTFKDLKETLSKSAKAEDWIKDFEDSDAPQFKGKSKEKRKEMALAAYYSAKRGMKEEVEQVDEGSPEFNARALRYAKANAAEKDREGRYSKKYPGGKEQHAKDTAAFMKRFPAPKNEEVEQNESVGTNRSVEMPHSFDVIVHDQNGKEVKVHKGVKALNKKHAETKVKYKHPEGHTCTAHMNEEVEITIKKEDDGMFGAYHDGKLDKKFKTKAEAEAHKAKEEKEMNESGPGFTGAPGADARPSNDVGDGAVIDSIADVPAKSKKLKKVLEMAVRDAAGKEHMIKKQKVRMADGTLKMLPPGKSDSSGH